MTRLTILTAVLWGVWWLIGRGLDAAARNLFGENE